LTRKRDDERTVYSTQPGFVAPKRKGVGKPAPSPAARNAGFPDDGVARVRRETQGRNGKTVTAVYGLRLGADQLAALGSELKRLCGTGGSAKDGVIEIQGEHVDRVIEALAARGHSAKRGGG
jgi:translation initiation factor 1